MGKWRCQRTCFGDNIDDDRLRYWHFAHEGDFTWPQHVGFFNASNASERIKGNNRKILQDAIERTNQFVGAGRDDFCINLDQTYDFFRWEMRDRKEPIEDDIV